MSQIVAKAGMKHFLQIEPFHTRLLSQVFAAFGFNACNVTGEKVLRGVWQS